MINVEVIQFTSLRAEERRKDASDLCVYQFIFVVAPFIEICGTQHWRPIFCECVALKYFFNWWLSPISLFALLHMYRVSYCRACCSV